VRLPTLSAENLMLKRGGSVNPANFSTEVFELLSIPAFDKGKPDIVKGCDIGSSKSRVEPNDVLLSKIVPHIRRCWVVPQKSKHRQIASGEWIIFRDERFYPDYLKHFLTSNIFHRQFMETVAGVGGSLVRARPSAVERIEIPLPPLAEQKRIAAILDKADNLRRKNQQAIQLADQFLRAVFLDMFGDPVTNLKRWEVKKLKEISHIQIGPFGTQLHKEDYIEGGIPLINPTHIVNGKIVSNMNYTIPSNKHAELDEYHLKAGDIIMGRRGEMGRCAVVTEQENGWLCGTGSLFIRTHNAEIFAEYLCTLLSGKTIKSYLEAESQGATMSNLNKTIVGNINIPVPSENALKKYSIIQENTMKNINKMGCFSGELLFNSLSQKAFAGEL
jgi:type I restriction enzyme S subunit